MKPTAAERKLARVQTLATALLAAWDSGADRTHERMLDLIAAQPSTYADPIKAIVDAIADVHALLVPDPPKSQPHDYPRCQAITAKGARCKSRATHDTVTYCAAHCTAETAARAAYRERKGETL